jgi:hypothetical protein
MIFGNFTFGALAENSGRMPQCGASVKFNAVESFKKAFPAGCRAVFRA